MDKRTDSEVSDFDSDYQVIRFSVSWGSLSIFAFILTLAVNIVGNDLGLSAATMGLAVAGVVLGLIGMKVGRRGRGAARAGTFLNGAVVIIFLVVAIVMPELLKALR